MQKSNHFFNISITQPYTDTNLQNYIHMFTDLYDT